VWEGVFALLSGLVAIALVVLQKKTARVNLIVKKAMEITEQAERNSNRMRNNIAEGKHYETKFDVDRVVNDIRALRSVLKKDLPAK
jgi:hypothetical protein